MAINKVIYNGNILIDLTADTIIADKLLNGYNAHGSNGESIMGTMQNNGSVAATIDGLTVTSYTIPKGFHSGSGTVSLTNDIENALAAI